MNLYKQCIVISSIYLHGVCFKLFTSVIFNIDTMVCVSPLDVDLHPRDPRWLGAWWLGFLVFGIGAIFFGIPLMFFPKSLVPKAVKRTQKSARKKKLTCGAIYREFKGCT